MCHQSVGLIAREIEARGIPTLSLTSALSITRAANPPRAAFVDFPLGRTAGKPNEPEQQRAMLRDALGAFAKLTTPGSVLSLPYRWAEDDAWKDGVMRPGNDRSGATGGSGDNRAERNAEPQYQCETDRVLAEQRFEADGCPTCVFLPEGASA
ncbi:MAG: hypothetical protein HKP27_12065 [Myxococcales bacterium]|nr:hypothetical protein [Myxococcales bacterium]